MFTAGEDRPLKGGEANGLGKGRRTIPVRRCGAALAMKAPPKKYAK
jgi:hypothetical protein